MSFISIILPVKDEPYLPTLLEQIERFVSYSHEVLVQTEKGLGYAVACGVKRAKGEVVVVCDADGSHPIGTIDFMVQSLNQCDIIIGSRYTKGGHTQDTWTRKLISRIYCEFAKELLNLKVKDNMSGFIVAKKEVFDKYPIRNNGYKFVVDLLYRSRKVFVAKEYPIVFEQRKAGKSKASSREAWNTLVFMLKLKASFK